MLIDILVLFLFFLTFLKINLYTFLFLVFTYLAFRFEKFKWLYLVSIIGALIVFKNPLPVLLFFVYEKAKKDNKEIYVFLAYFLTLSFFYTSIKTIILSVFMTILISLKEKKLFYLILIPLLFIPTFFTPYQYISKINLGNMNIQTNLDNATSTFQEREIVSSETQNEININTQEFKYNKYENIIFFLLFFVGIFSLYILFKFRNKPTIKVVLGIIVTVSFAYMLFLILFPYLGKDFSMPQSEMNFDQQLTQDIEIQSPLLEASTTLNTNIEKTYNLVNLLKIGMIILVLFLLILLIIVVYLIKNINAKQLEKIEKKPQAVWQTYDTYEDILKLNSKDLIRRIYVYIRAKVFPWLFYLTPYELEKEIKDPDLSYITELFVKSEYGKLKIEYNPEKLKNILKKIVERYNPQILQNH